MTYYIPAYFSGTTSVKKKKTLTEARAFAVSCMEYSLGARAHLINVIIADSNMDDLGMVGRRDGQYYWQSFRTRGNADAPLVYINKDGTLRRRS